jgi:hypothetical protein
VEALHNMPVHDAGTRDFVNEFLALDQPTWTAEESRTALMAINRIMNSSHAHLLFAARIVFRFKLLDAASDAMGVPRQEGLQSFPHIPAPPLCSNRMKKVRGYSRILLGLMQGCTGFGFPQGLAYNPSKLMHRVITARPSGFRFVQCSHARL